LLYWLHNSTTALCFSAVAITLLGQLLGTLLVYVPADRIARNVSQPAAAAILAHAFYLLFIFVWLTFFALIYFVPKNRFILKHITSYAWGNTPMMFAIGLAVGFISNASCVLVAVLHKDVALSFNPCSPFLLLTLFICVFVQASAEELIFRGYLYQRLLKKNQDPLLSMLISSLIFAALHMLNESITPLAFINLFLYGIFLTLFVEYFESIWAAFAVHTVWNYTQNIIFGLPNSGTESTYSVFNSTIAGSSLFYDSGFGLEGGITATILLTLLIVSTIILGQNKRG